MTEATQKRERTRQALLDATRSIVFERGHDKISITEITQRANVATGTFYNYFPSKQCAFEAVLAEIKRQFNVRLDEVRERIQDPALRMATTLRFTFQEARENHEWNMFLNYSGRQNRAPVLQDEARLRDDLELGVQGGRFQVDSLDLTHTLLISMIRQVNLDLRANRLSVETIDSVSKSIMKMLGLTEIVTRGLIQAPLPSRPAPRHRPTTAEVPANVVVLKEVSADRATG
ncbi:MAG: TetR/AcrR family transcriptional regulator [Pseudomonadota bacterium]